MLCLECDANAQRVEVPFEMVCDLGGEALLHLQPASEPIHHAGKFRETDDALRRHIPDVGNATKGQHVVLTERGERDVANEDELGVSPVIRERCQCEWLRREQFDKPVDNAPRRVDEVFTIWVLTKRCEQLAHCRLGARPVCAGVCGERCEGVRRAHRIGRS